MNPAWPHQKEGTKRTLENQGYGLFFEMGCGKTRTAIDAISVLPPMDVLILCPKAVVTVWPEEFRKYAPDLSTPIICLSGTTKDKAEQVKEAPSPAIFVCNYDSFWRDELAKALLKRSPKIVIADEIHRIKSPTGKSSKFSRLLGAKAIKRIGLSGTPFPNSPLDAWAVMGFIDPTLFPMKFPSFRDLYAIQRPLPGQPFVRIVCGYRNLAQMQRLIEGRSMVVKSDDVLELPPTIHQRLAVELSSSTRKIYDTLENEMVVELEGGTITAANALVLVARLQQITSGFSSRAVVKDGIETKEAFPIGNEKEERLTDFLEDLDRKEKVVVFYRFFQDKLAIHRATIASGRKCFEVSGQGNTLAQWKESEGGSVIAIQQASGGSGISSVEARYVCYFSLSHNLGEHLQTLARCHRPGQTRKVFFFHLVANGTIDEQIYEALEKKEEVISHIVKKAQHGKESRDCNHGENNECS